MAGLTGDILIVDDERSLREFLAIFLRRNGHRVDAAADADAARKAMAEREFDVVITDLKMPDASGLDVLAECKRLHPNTQVIVVTAFATAETAIAAMKAGAYDYLTKPFKVDEVGLVVERALERRVLQHQNVVLRDEIKGRYKLDRLIGKSPAMHRVFEVVRKIASARTSVLLIGESGTGKELAARALHELSGRADHAFIAVNCGAIPESLIESEFFGHVKGSFTGANTDRTGLFEAAHGGTIFLDEIGELPSPMQVKLLRVLQERKVKRVGGVQEKEVDVRVVAATNRDLETEVEKGTFRQDLFYRLNVIQLRLPPLRERREDIPILVDHFVRKLAAEHGRQITGVDPDAMSALMSHSYPGQRPRAGEPHRAGGHAGPGGPHLLGHLAHPQPALGGRRPAGPRRRAARRGARSGEGCRGLRAGHPDQGAGADAWQPHRGGPPAGRHLPLAALPAVEAGDHGR